MAGLLGGLLVRSLAVAVVPVICLALAVVGPLARLTTVIAVVASRRQLCLRLWPSARRLSLLW